MPRGIEHRNKVTLLQAYDNYELVQWAIYAGKEQVMCYEGDNLDESLMKLTEVLEAIEASGTNNVYVIRFYSEDTKEITTKTGFKGSTTFMFGGAPLKTENGVTIIDRTAKHDNYIASKPDPAIQQRLDKLETQLNREQELRHQAELKLMKADFDHRISGMNENKAPEIMERIVGMITEKPETIQHLFEGIGNLIDKFLKKPEPLQPQGAISGTGHTQHTIIMEQDEAKTNGGASAATAADDQATAKQLEDRLNDALDSIENKIGTQKMVAALEAIAKMDADKLNGFIMMI